MENQRLRLSVALVAILELCGCGGEAPPRLVQVRDSAGITVVENKATSEAELDQWWLPDSPLLEIGVAEGDPEYQLHDVRSAVRLQDGRIVVANAGTQEIRFYDREGRFIQSVGREGEGPGEFVRLSWLKKFAVDSLAAWDWGTKRVTIFDCEGRLVRSLNLAQLPGVTYPSPVGVFDDGRLLVNNRIRPDLVAGRVTRAPVVSYLVDSNGELTSSVGEQPGTQIFFVMIEERPVAETLPFGRRPRFALFKDRFYAGTSDTYEIRIYGEDGTQRRIIRLEYENREVTAQHIERYKQTEIAPVPDPWRQQLEQWLAEAPIPETMPAYGPLMVDAEGNLWVRQYLEPGGEPTHWRVFDAEGQLVALAVAPGGFLPLEMGSDYVLGRWRDEMDVEYVRMYTLHKG